MIAKAVAMDSKKRQRWRKTECLVIDEISMMTPQLLELLDHVGRHVRKRLNEPFGGMQVVFVGDFYQLPPVAKETKTVFAFESPLWKEVVQATVHLTTIVRQADPAFQKILNEARRGRMSPDSMAALAARRTKSWKKQRVKPTLLFTKNAEVNAINEGQLEKLEGQEHTFEVKTILPASRPPADVVQLIVDKLDKDAPYEQELRLKVGAQVMLLVNLDPAAGLVNGSRGVVTDFGPDGLPAVEFLRGPGCPVKIAKHQWKSDSDPKIAILREQIPLRLAYAITIHKAQGATLDSALVDVGPSTFEYGQAYVALSRVRSLDSLYVYELHEGAFRAHPTVEEFYRTVLGEEEKPTT